MADAFPFRLYGGATRPDAISGLNPGFANALLALYAAAPPEVQRELGLNSAYRSPKVQAALYARSDKTGHTVAAPGKSRHNYGEAADLYGFGLKGGAQVSQATKDWVHANASKYGLTFPMSHEPWHIQLARSPGQSGPGAMTSATADILPTSEPGVPEEEAPETSNLSRLFSAALTPSGDTESRTVQEFPSFDPGTTLLEIPSAIPAALPAGRARAMAPVGTLADLFTVRPVGQAGTALLPGRRF
jgi:hypothetical protein